ncbi:ABC transporter ATP-binding protein [Mobiluncus mulieris]|uniref:ABC transporter ATP-binding protein n=1 Tax=Mobiluncus mulieris TaxID=2052 RepID=UPI00243268B1|nr:ABC transporter ATP-binding protein [Mobiluncus mulieris]
MSLTDVSPKTAIKASLSYIADKIKWKIIILFTATLILGFTPAIQVYLISQVVEHVAIVKNVRVLVFLLSVLSGILIMDFILANLIKYMNDKMLIDIVFDVDRGIVNMTVPLEVEQFESEITYNLIQRVDNNTGNKIFGIFDSLRSSLQSLISIISVSVVIYSWNPWIAVLLCVGPIPGILGNYIIQKYAFEIAYLRAPKERRAKYYRSLLTSDSARKEIILYNFGKKLYNRYVKFMRVFRKQDNIIAKRSFVLASTLGLTSIVVNIIAIVFGTVTAIDNANVGQLAGFITAASSMGLYVTQLLTKFGTIYQNSLYISNWLRLTKLTPSKIDSGNLDIEESKPPKIEFVDVSFRYPGTEILVLKSVSFIINPGECVAFVGPNGSGKTTILKLLLRFYEIDSGRILINDIPIQEYSRSSLYMNFSALFQDFTRYEFSLAENVSVNFTEELSNCNRIMNVLESVGLSELPKILPNGLKSILGRKFEGGVQLSLGQWQRIAIARALYRNPILLVLDEPTSSTDTITEKNLFQHISNDCRNQTIILVSHSVDTIKIAAKIFVVDEGKIIADGTHHELLRKCQTYATLFLKE